jgi:ADP-ribose pyrophosphatase YjhB (NUDIX family)
MTYWQQVTSYNLRQYKTGSVQTTGGRVADDIYAQALDHLVIACVDVVIVHNKKILIGKRVWEPQPDWWIIGGRMRKGELYAEAAVRNLKRELGVEFDGDRFGLLGVYNLIWDKRAQAPVDNGCHMLSVTMYLELNDKEKAAIKLNEEYSEHSWIEPDEIINRQTTFHPCLIQMATDLRHLAL